MYTHDLKGHEELQHAVEGEGLSEVTYTPESRIAHPLEMLKDMWRDLLAARHLGWQLAVRDIKAQYRQTFMGYFWAFVPALIAGVSLTVASNNKVIDFGETDIPYTAYVIIGMVLWQTFMEVLSLQIQTVSAAKSMLTRLNFPREALFLAATGKALFNFSIKLLLILATFLWFQLIPPATILFVPFALIPFLLLGVGAGVLLSPIGALYQDVGRGVMASTMALLIVTPAVFVPPEEGLYATVVALNPISPLLTAVRDLATTGVLTYPVGFVIASLFACMLFLAAWMIYRLAMPIIIERMSS